MSVMEGKLTGEKLERIAPRARILAAACDLFYRHGIRAVGVEAIAEAAETNKMTLYRHFSSKDELVAEYLRCLAEEVRKGWDRRAAAHPGDPLAQLRAWLAEMAAHVASGNERGCALANAAVEIPEKDHPARRVIEAYKGSFRDRLAQLCASAGLTEPELLADELFLLLEGARVTAQSIGPQGLDDRFLRMSETMIMAHTITELSAGPH
jgi:AcrR family transcriptional regulator